MIWRLKSLTGFLICTLVIACIGVFLMTSVAYCDEYRTWTMSDLKNVLLNSIQEKTNYNIETAKSKLDLQDSNLQLVLDDLNNYGYNYISWRTSGFDIDIQFFDTSNLTYSHPYLASNALVFLHTPTGKYTNIFYNGGDWYFTYKTNINDPSSYSHVNNIYYSGTIVYQNYNTNSSIIRNGGAFSPSNLFDENYYSNARFDITLNTDNNTEYIYIDTETGNQLTYIPVLYNNNFGYLTDTTYIYYIDDLLGFWYFDGNTWKYKLIYNNSSDSVLLKSNNYISFIYDAQNNNEVCDLLLKDIYSYNNVVYHFSVTNAQLDSASCYFLIGDNNTIISSGALVVSGDYFVNGEYTNQFSDLDNQINGNNNTQAIIDNINNGDEVDSIVDDFLGESGEQLAESLGYSPITNTYAEFIYGLIDDICDTLYDTGDVYFDYTLHGGEPYRIYSSDIYLPDGALKTFISGFLIFGACFIIYRHFKRLIDAFNSADLGLIINYDVDDINIYYL